MQSKKIKFLAAGGLLLSALITVLLIYDWTGGKTQTENVRGMVISEDATDWQTVLNNQQEGQQGIQIPGYGEITVLKKDSSWNLALVNPKDNSCYLKYSLQIGEEGDVIYESDLIEPGKAIQEFEVKNPPEAGDYQLYMNIRTFSMNEDLTEMNGAQVKTDLHVV